jgi:hypothetical protein
MEGGVFQLVHFGCYLGHGIQAFAGGPRLPVTVLLVFHRLKALVFSDRKPRSSIHDYSSLF